MKSNFLVGILVGVIAVGVLAAVIFSDRLTVSPSAPLANVSLVDGVQVIDISARGGYFPAKTIAQAGVPTLLRVNTSNTFDCSSALRIPSLGINKNLPPSGVTEIPLGSPESGVIQGVCSMGMYSFAIDFQS